MEKFEKHILPLLAGGDIRYLDCDAARSVSAGYFRNSFKEIAAAEVPGKGWRLLYYQGLEYPDLVMHFKVSEKAGVSALLMRYSDFERHLEMASRG